MSVRRVRNAFFRVVVWGVALQQSAGAAHGAALSWSNAAGGSAATAGNWNPAQLPTGADDLLFNLNSTYSVTYNASANASHTHTYRRGTVTLSLGSPHAVSAGVIIGDTNALTGTATLTTGTLTSNAGVTLGSIAGSAGVLNVNDDDADFIISGATSDMIVGSNGAGTLNLTGGGLVQVADQFILGSNATSVANLTVSGQLAVFPFTQSTFNVIGTSDSRLGQGGDATVNISNGGLAAFDGNLVIANGSASTSTVTVGGLGLIADATLDVAGDILVGRNTSAGIAAGVGTLTVNDHGDVFAGDTLFIGDPDGSTGLVHVDAGGSLTAHSIIVDDVSGGLALFGGITTVDGGTLDPRGTTLLVNNNVNLPTLELINGADTTLSSGTTALQIGNTGLGALRVDGAGSTLTVTSGDTIIGDSLGGDGELLGFADATITLPSADTLTVGHNGDGLIRLSTGSDLASGTTFVGSGPDSNNSQVAVVDPGCTWTVTGGLFASGDASASSGGVGSVAVGSGGVITVNGAGTNVHVWQGGGRLDILSGGTLNSNGIVEVDGTLNLDGGVLNATTLNLDQSATARGTINADFNLRASNRTLALDGDLAAGRAASNNGFINAGTIAVGAHTLTVLDANQASLGNCNVDLGGRVVAANGIINAGGKTIFGAGTINANVVNIGTIASAGNGLNFAGILSGIGQGITGPSLHFLSGGGFTGSGTLGSTVAIDGLAGSIITATGPLTLGNSVDPTGFETAGELHCGANAVTLLDFDTAFIGSFTTLAGGQLIFATGGIGSDGKPISMANGGALQGHGTVFAHLTTGLNSVVTADGDLAIGDAGNPNGANIRGALHVGTHHVELRSTNDVPLGPLTTLAGGVLEGPNSGNPLAIASLDLSAGDVLEGFGFVDAQLTGSTSSTINATGQLQIAGTANGIFNGSFAGTLNVQGHVVTYAGSPTLGGATNLADGSLVTGGAIENMGTLNGPGIVVGDMFNFGAAGFGSGFGTIKPNGDMTLVGDLFNNSAAGIDSTLSVAVNGPQPGQFDRLIVNGAAHLGDMLIINAPLNLNAPVGAKMVILSAAGGRTGVFEDVIGEKISTKRAFQVQYNATQVVLTVRAFSNGFFGCDTNCDGSINQFDITPFINTLTTHTGCSPIAGDANGDGTANQFDIQAFIGCLSAP